jgi:hypothetical protein
MLPPAVIGVAIGCDVGEISGILGVKMQHKIPLSGISTKYTSQNTVAKK